MPPLRYHWFPSLRAWTLPALLALFLAAALPLPSARAQLEQEGRTVNFRVYLWPQRSDLSGYTSKEMGGTGAYVYVSPEIAYQATPGPEGEVKTLKATDGRLSPSYRYRGTGPLVFFREEKFGEDQTRRVPLASVDLNALSNDSVLVFVPSRDPNKPGYNILPVTLPTGGIPAGESIFYNLTPYRLAVHTGHTPKLFEPGAVAGMPTSTDNAMPLRILIEDEEGWGLRYTEQRLIGKNEQLLFFIYPHATAKKRVHVRSINIAQ